jgi:glycosyltransferase involved in cell wall biosynthesis
MVLLEAQAAGLPIVSFACKCGPKDVVKDGIDGYLVEEGDVNALASRLISLMDDEITRKKMGFVAFSRSDRYAEESVMAKWVDLFDKVLKG